MTPDVVVDIGNSRMKWGLCTWGHVTELVRLPLDDPSAWDAALAKLPPPESSARKWAVASVNPPVLQRFVAWSKSHGDTVVFEKYTDLPIRVNVDQPETIGLDRLCGAVAARSMSLPDWPAITVDVGTAVTVNLIDAEGVFQGGAIFPGPRLMGRALHEFTAKLPLIDLTDPIEGLWRPAKNTADAIRQGIDAALGAGIAQLVDLFIDQCSAPPLVFVMGGGGHLITGYSFERASGVRQNRSFVLEGIIIAAEALP